MDVMGDREYWRAGTPYNPGADTYVFASSNVCPGGNPEEYNEQLGARGYQRTPSRQPYTTQSKPRGPSQMPLKHAGAKKKIRQHVGTNDR